MASLKPSDPHHKWIAHWYEELKARGYKTHETNAVNHDPSNLNPEVRVYKHDSHDILFKILAKQDSHKGPRLKYRMIVLLDVFPEGIDYFCLDSDRTIESHELAVWTPDTWPRLLDDLLTCGLAAIERKRGQLDRCHSCPRQFQCLAERANEENHTYA